ncbi:MAG: PAS domain-containing protein [Chitinophagaceae bacterium]
MAKNNDSRPASAPLHSWDIFMEGYQKRMALANDFNELNKLSAAKKWISEWDYETRLFEQGKVIIVTDPLLNIVYATSNIFEMNGYTQQELKGKSTKIFQGKSTSLETRLVIRTAIKSLQSFDTTILNYKKNQRPYYCHIEGYPVFNKNKVLTNFIAFENVTALPSM